MRHLHFLRIRNLVFPVLCGFMATLVAPANGQEDNTRAVHLMAAASDPLHQGFVRVANRSTEAGDVVMEAIDDAGSVYGPITLALAAGQTIHFNSDDLEYGNDDKGLSGGVGPGSGQWRLELRSDLDLDVLSYMRHRDDGYLTSLHDLAPERDGGYYVAFFNPGGNAAQVSMLRLINAGPETAQVEITGLDDGGESPGATVSLTLDPLASRTLTAAELESGSAEGLSGALGDGAGKWRLRVESDSPLRVMSLLQDPTAHLANLSSVPPPTVKGDLNAYRVLWFPAQGFVRVINNSDREGKVEILAFAPSVASLSSRPFPFGGARQGSYVISTVELSIGANSARHFNATDLASGNADKGLPDGVDPSLATSSLLQLQLRSDLDIEVLSYLRSDNGFLASVHDGAPHSGDVHHVATLNPGNNLAQQSVLALLNPRSRGADVRITAVDDQGKSPGSLVELRVNEMEALLLSAQDLEVGRRNVAYPFDQSDAYWSVSGALGDGAGKWRLRVESSAPIQVMSLLLSPTGHVTNLSTAPGAVIPDVAPPLPANPLVAAPGAVDIPDADLRLILEAALGKAEDATISPAEMATLRQIDESASYPWISTSRGTLDDVLCIEDLTGLEAAVNLERLYLPYTCATSLMPLSTLGNLRVLDIESTDFTDLSPLGGLTNLQVLNLEDSFVDDISPLRGAANLEVLKLIYTGVADFSPLDGLSRLRILELPTVDTFFNPDVDLSPVGRLAGLEELVGLQGYGDVDLSWLPGLTNLQKLHVNGVSDLSLFAGLTGLRELVVELPEVASVDLAPLGGLADLRVLSLWTRSPALGLEPPSILIRDLAPISHLGAMVELNLRYKMIEDVSVLSGMTGLTKVWLGNNRIADLSPLVDNPHLGDGDLVYVPHNPLSDESIDEHVTALQARGAVVIFRPTLAE